MPTKVASPELLASPPACPSWADLDVSTLAPLPETPYTATFEQVWRTVRDKHYDPTLNCQDWPARRLEFGAQLAAASDAPAAYATMNAMLGTLGQSHFKVVGPSQATPTVATGSAVVPIRVRVIEDQVVVVETAVGGAVSKVPQGAVLLAIDDVPVTKIVDEAKATALRPGEVRFLSAQTITARIHGNPNETRKLKFLDPRAADAEVELAVPCVEPTGELVSLGNLRDIRTTVDHRMVSGTSVGYLAFNFWMLPMVQRVEAAMTELRGQGMTALVLDLRGNPGGVGAMSIPVARMLLTQPGNLGTLKFRDFDQDFNVAGNPNAFAGPVAVLIDEGTASTSEIFVAGLRDLGRIQVFGASPSAGAALPSMIERLEGGGMLQYVVGDYHSSRGAVAEGDGVRPDVTVPESRADFIAGRDPVLAAAVTALTPHP